MNVNAVFNYKDNKIVIQCNSDDKMINICKKFSIKIGADVKSKIYIYKENLLNLDLTYGQQINDQEEDIKVIDNTNLVTIKYNYEGLSKEVQLPRQENILKRISSIIKTPINKINFLLNGELASEEDYDKDFTQLSNSQNKTDNSINLVIVDREDDEEESSNKKDEENKDNDKKNKKGPKPFTQWIKLLNKTYIISIVQLVLIEILLILGFYFNLNKAFTQNLGSMLGTFIPVSLICGIFSFFFFLFAIKENIKIFNKIVYFSLVIYIPLMIMNCFLLSEFIEIKYILGLLTLLLLNYVSVEFAYIIFKIKKNYSYAVFASIINVIYLVIFFIIFKETSIKAFILMPIIALLIIVYIQLFNYSLLFSLTEDDYIHAAEVLDYFLFVPIGGIYGIIILLVGIILLLLLIMLAFFFESFDNKEAKLV